MAGVRQPVPGSHLLGRTSFDDIVGEEEKRLDEPDLEMASASALPGQSPPEGRRRSSIELSDATSKKIGAAHRTVQISELAFLNLSLTLEVKPVVPKGEKKPKGKVPLKVLDNISGEAQSNEMLALMGPSGSGKTSLLNCLAQRVPPKAVSGGVYVDGKPLTKTFKRQMGFVFQDDLMLPALTVRETIMFAAMLRLPQAISTEIKQERVDGLISLLGLSHVANSLIGTEARRGVSGGERKRVAIGVELVTMPAVLFLDEPTSGLDSSTALSICALLSKLAKRGMIVICSIHQPRANIFAKFDKVVLLKKGQTVFYGRVQNVHPYFTGLGLEIPPLTNIADWILDVVTNVQTLPDGRTLPEAYTGYVAKANPADIGLPTRERIEAAKAKYTQELDTKWVTSFWYQLRVLLQRGSKQSKGEVFTGVNTFQILAVGVIASAVWWQSTNLQDKTGTLFFISIQQSFNALSGVMRLFPAERGLMMRERSTGSYRVGPYFLAKSMSDLTLSITLPIVFGCLVYWSVGLRPNASHFVVFLCFFISEILTAQAMGMFLSAVVWDFATANSISFVGVLVLMLFGGFYVKSDNLPLGLRWIKYCSFLYWGFGALLVNEFRGREFDCSQDTGTNFGHGQCPVPGNSVLEEYGFDDMVLWHSIVILWAMIIFYRAATYVVLRKTTKLVH